MINDVGKRIAELRKQNGWSQMELAQKLNVTDKAISKWENGGMPSVDLFPKLSKIFNVSIDYLMLGDGEDESEQEEASESTPQTFEESIADFSIDELQLILDDQRELYSNEEFAVLEQRYKDLLEQEEEEADEDEEDEDEYDEYDEYEEFNRLADEENEVESSQRENDDGCLLYFVAFICPLAGIIWGAVRGKMGVVLFSIVMTILSIVVSQAILLSIF